VAERLWAAEQALRCTQVAAVLAWLPAAMPLSGALGRQGLQFALRRLQQAVPLHGLLFLMRPPSVQAEPSSARLRLGLDGTDRCAVRILKRRGPPLARPVELPLHPLRLAAVLQDAPGRFAGAHRPWPSSQMESTHASPDALDCALAA
jgi:protein ImuA